MDKRPSFWWLRPLTMISFGPLIPVLPLFVSGSSSDWVDSVSWWLICTSFAAMMILALWATVEVIKIE